MLVGPARGDKAAALRTLSAKAAAGDRAGRRDDRGGAAGARDAGLDRLGRGFAVPHARIEGLDRFFCLFARLARPIDFAAIDDQPVDLVFLLLIPERAGNDHVTALSAIARQMRPDAALADIRRAKTAEAVYARLTQNTASPAATA